MQAVKSRLGRWQRREQRRDTVSHTMIRVPGQKPPPLLSSKRAKELRARSRAFFARPLKERAQNRRGGPELRGPQTSVCVSVTGRARR
jgi:hypothetical protein